MESTLNKQRLAEFYRQMLLIRRFEEACGRLYMQGKIRGFLHLYIGEEAIAVGAISALRPDDYVIGHYRDHGHAIAKGMGPKNCDGGVVRQSHGKQRRQGRLNAPFRC